MRTRVPVFLILVSLFLQTLPTWSPVPAQAANTPLKILRVTPHGVDVPAGRQIVIQFNRPVVPLGRMERTAEEIPIHISPSLNCQWRWLNTSALACQLNEQDTLKPAHQYTLTIRPEIKAEDGGVLDSLYIHEFTTQRPRVTYSWFKTWKAPGSPVIRVTFNQPVTQTSVQDHVYLTVDSPRGKRYPLNVEPDPNDRQPPRFVKIPGEKTLLDFGRPPKQKSDDQKMEKEGIEARRIWLVQPHQELPLDTDVHLNIEPGLVSALGPEPGATRRVVKRFRTFPEFKFLGITCWDNGGQKRLLDKKNHDLYRCNPLNTISLTFSAPVISDEVKTHVTLNPDLAGGRKDYDPWANAYSYSRLNQPHRKGKDYRVSFPENLKAYEDYSVTSKPNTLKDEFGRTLAKGFALEFSTDHRKPDFNLIHQTAVLEKQEKTEVPLVVTNLDDVTLKYKRLTPKDNRDDLNHKVTLPEAEDIAFAIPLDVRQALGSRSGALYGKLYTTPRVSMSEYQRTLFAQVTPFAVHVKIGHYNTSVWVVDMATGKPVSGAKVSIYKDTIAHLSGTNRVLTRGVTDKEGLALLDGTQILDPKLKTMRWGNDQATRLFVRVDKGEDMALVPLDQRRFVIDVGSLSNYEVYSSQRRVFGHLKTWGATAQGVYRAGDTIQFKIHVRDQDNNRFVQPPLKGYSLKVYDPMGKTVHEVKKFDLSPFGTYSGEFTVPKNGAVGWYEFSLNAKFTTHSWYPLQVLVTDFTPSPFRVSSSLNGERFEPDDRVEVNTRAQMHAGGPYADAPTRITAMLHEKTFHSQHPLAKAFTFTAEWARHYKTLNLFHKVDAVDHLGSSTQTFAIPADKVKDIYYGNLSVESAVKDDRGKYIATLAVAKFMGRDRFVGLNNTRWLYQEGDPAEIEFIVVDGTGKPVSDTPVTIQIERRVTKASRVKGAGNAYLTQYVHSWEAAATCEGTPASKPETCTFTPQAPGSYRMTATVKDTRDRVHTAQIRAWVAGKGRVLWEDDNTNALKIIPEKDDYKIGDTARYLIQNPFPGATALITVERFGVIKQWTRTFDTATPVVEFKVEPDFLPGFYLSVLVVSPRVDKPLGEDNVDLGKPAFRMGYLSVPVKDPYKQLLLTAKSGKDLYKPRDRVKVSLNVKPRFMKSKEPVEIAVAVLDEAVFDLLRDGRDTFDPYKGFYHLDALDLKNFSLLNSIIGRQKFEKKGANPGGDGGDDVTMRSMFKFVSYWNPSVTPDTNGNVTVEFDAPDNLTGWRILAMGTTPNDLMGLGEGTFKVNKNIELRPVMPNQVTEGDQFNAGFSVMNRTGKPKDITVTITAEGHVDASQKPSVTHTVNVQPFKRVTVYLPVTTTSVEHTRQVEEGEVRFKVVAKSEGDTDGLIHKTPVRKRRSLETAANYGSTLLPKAEDSILFPKNIHDDVGTVSVVVSPTVIGNVEGAFKYMRDYPYICWEQILSKGVMASHYQNLKGYLPDDFKWALSADWVKETLQLASSYQAPNGGMAYYVPRNQYVSPYLSAYTALAFNWLRDAGHVIPSDVEKKLHRYLIRLLKRDVMPTFYSKGMSSTVRAVALAALSYHRKIGKKDIDRYKPHVPFMSLFGKAHFLQAALKTKGTLATANETLNAIFAHSSQSAGKFSFVETLDDSYSRILATPLRTQCAILTTFTQAARHSNLNKKIGQTPFKLVRFITQSRGQRDRWENTQENMFCMNALIDYSRAYESTPPKYLVKAVMDKKVLGEKQFQDLRGGQETFERPIQKGDPGRKTKVEIRKTGMGRLYYSTRLAYAPLEEHAERQNAGIEIRKEYTVERNGEWVLLEDKSKIRRGDLVRVDIFISIPTSRNFVVVDDPVPGGLEPVNRQLATASTVDADKGKFKAAGGSWWFHFSDWRYYNTSRWSFYHKELRHDSVRFYSDYLGPGNYHLSYVAQTIATGEFVKMPIHAEEMYDPDVFGKGIPSRLIVEE